MKISGRFIGHTTISVIVRFACFSPAEHAQQAVVKNNANLIGTMTVLDRLTTPTDVLPRDLGALVHYFRFNHLN